MNYLIRLTIIIFAIIHGISYANENIVSNNKIIFKLNNKAFTSIDLENRKIYLEILNNVKIDDSEKDSILNDYISALIFFENYNINKINIINLDEEIHKNYVEKFKKYYDDNNNALTKIDKKIIIENIKMDLIRQRKIEQILNTKKEEIFEKNSDLDLLYNFNIKYLTAKENVIITSNLDYIFNRSDLLNLEKKLKKNKINYLLKEKEINNIGKLSSELKNLIEKDKKILIKKNNSNIIIISIEKKFASYENIFVTLVNLKVKKQIDNNNLNCNYINELKDKIIFNEYKYSSLNNIIKENLFKINDYILLKENDIFNYIFLCKMRFDKNILNEININKKVQNFAKNIENNFIKKYYKLYNIIVLNE